MASEKPATFSYLCILPDFAEGSKRLSVRQQHLDNAKDSFASGKLEAGGATFAEDRATNPSAKMNGSWLVVNAESAEAAREWLEKDIYATGGAWDLSKVQIIPVAVSKH